VKSTGVVPHGLLAAGVAGLLDEPSLFEFSEGGAVESDAFGQSRRRVVRTKNKDEVAK
jgi:hypothetical protein